MEPLKIVKYAESAQMERELLLRRSELDVDATLLRATKIVSDVRREGDKALLEYTERFDEVKLGRDSIRVSEGEFVLARSEVSAGLEAAIEKLAGAIEKFHRRQMPKQWRMEISPGIKAGQLVRPLDSVGVYVPGGLAYYPSTLLMAAIPARVAGVNRVAVCTPPNREGKISPAVLVAAQVAGVSEVYKAGGAQAIAALAYGTETIPKVDKIVGPGNIHVAAAKQVVAPNVEVDFVAGPSEVLILADDSANPKFIAADLVSQAEHGTEAAAVLVTTSEVLARRVHKEAQAMVKENPRWQLALRSLLSYGRIVVFKKMDDALDFANAYAPEHLQLMVRQPKKLLKRVRNAGSVFLGEYSPVAAGDLAVGVNHILPTGGVARRRSGLSVMDFLRMPTFQELTKAGLKEVADVVKALAEAEGLPGHARAVEERLKEG